MIINLFEFAGLLLSLLLVIRFFVGLISKQRRSWIQTHPIRHLAWVLFVGAYWSGYLGSCWGYCAAHLDLIRGHYEVQGCGLLSPEHG